MKAGWLVRSTRNPMFLGEVVHFHGDFVTVRAVDGSAYDAPGFECVRPGAEQIVPVEQVYRTCPADPACEWVQQGCPRLGQVEPCEVAMGV